jgi:hypothetical protein
MASSNSTPLVLRGRDYSGQRVFVSCRVPSGQVLIEIQREVNSGIWDGYSIINASDMFHFECPDDVPVDVRFTPSGGATVIIPVL